MQGEGIGSALMDRAQAGRDVAIRAGPRCRARTHPLDTRDHHLGHGHGQRAADLQRPVRAPRDAAARSRLAPARRAAALVRASRRCPPTLESVPFEAIAADGRDGSRRLAGIVEALDREIVGIAHPQDHEYLRRDGRTGFLVRERGTGRALGYGYGTSAGRLGPVAALDPALHPAILGTIVRETPVLGPVAAWVPGHRGGGRRAPCWTPACVSTASRGSSAGRTATHPFARYLPISLALV